MVVKEVVLEEEVLVVEVVEEEEEDLVVEMVLVDMEVATVVVVVAVVVDTVGVMVNRVVGMGHLVEDMGNKVVVMDNQVEGMAVNQVGDMVVSQTQVMVDNKMVEVSQAVDTVDSKVVTQEANNRAVDMVSSNMAVRIVEATTHNPLLVDMDLNHNLQDNTQIAEAMGHPSHQLAITLPQPVVRDTVHQQQQLEVSPTEIRVMDNSPLPRHMALVAMGHNKRPVNLVTVVKAMAVKVGLTINQGVHKVHILKAEIPITHLTEALQELVVMVVVQGQVVLMGVLKLIQVIKETSEIHSVCLF